MSIFRDYIYSDKFPLKLWNILNCSTTKAIQWTGCGRTISIEFNSFQKEYLDTSIFKTKNMHSFIRQLNLYGFRNVKLKERDQTTDIRNKSLHEYYNPLFHIVNKDLAMTVKRKVRVDKSKCTSHDRESAGWPTPSISSTATAIKSRLKAEKWFALHRNHIIRPCEDNEEFRKSVVTKMSPKVCESRSKLLQALQLVLNEFKKLNDIPSSSDDNKVLLVSQVEITPPSTAAKDVEGKARAKMPRTRRGRQVKTRATNTRGKAKLRPLYCKAIADTVPLSTFPDRLVFTEQDANASNISNVSSCGPPEVNHLALDELLNECGQTRTDGDDTFEDAWDVDEPLKEFSAYATATVLDPVTAFAEPSEYVPFTEPFTEQFTEPSECVPVMFNRSPLASRELGVQGYSMLSPTSSDNASQMDIRAMPVFTWEEHQQDLYTSEWISTAKPQIPSMVSPSFSRFNPIECEGFSLDRYFNVPEDDIFTTMSKCLDV